MCVRELSLDRFLDTAAVSRAAAAATAGRSVVSVDVADVYGRCVSVYRDVTVLEDVVKYCSRGGRFWPTELVLSKLLFIARERVWNCCC